MAAPRTEDVRAILQKNHHRWQSYAHCAEWRQGFAVTKIPLGRRTVFIGFPAISSMNNSTSRVLKSANLVVDETCDILPEA